MGIKKATKSYRPVPIPKNFFFSCFWKKSNIKNMFGYMEEGCSKVSKLDHENMKSDSEEFDTSMHPSFNTYITMFSE